MGYIAVKGGSEAIEASLKRLRFQRLEDGAHLDVDSVRGSLKVLVDQVMAEASLYDETTASLAIKQGEGSPEEAVFLLRAFRSTLPRLHYSRETTTESMWTERRISASFKDIPGGQILGSSPDYSHRLLDWISRF
jgi:alpha-D-ribose 1-methylphosphonate 5-triphosphate synthase subunit PhnI